MTGVQTCALPISAPVSEEEAANRAAYQRINAATQNANTPPRNQEIAAKIAGAKNIGELNDLLGLPNQRIRG